MSLVSIPKQRNFTVPVTYAGKSGGRAARRLGVTDVIIGEIGSADAPVAARWRDAAENIDIQYRSWNGRLWRPVDRRDIHGLSTRVLALSSGDPAGWGRMLQADESVVDIIRHPLQREHYVPGPSLVDGTISYEVDAPYASDAPDFVKRAADAQKSADNHLLIDGETWRATVGPQIEILGGRHAPSGEPSLMWVNPYRSARNAAGAFLVTEAEAAAELAREKWPDIRISILDVEVIDQAAFTHPSGAYALAGAAWDAIVSTKQPWGREATHAFVGAIADTREAFEGMFPDVAFNWMPYSHTIQWAFRDYEVAGSLDVSPLFEPFERLRNSWIYAKEGPVEKLRDIAVVRAAREMAARSTPTMEDDAALEGFRP